MPKPIRPPLPVSRRHVLHALGSAVALAACGSTPAGRQALDALTRDAGTDAAANAGTDAGAGADAGTRRDSGSAVADAAADGGVDAQFADIAAGDIAAGDIAAGDIAAGDIAAGDIAAGDAAVADTTAVVTVNAPKPIAKVTSNANHFVTTCCSTPKIDASTWSLEFRAEGKFLAKLDLAFLNKLKARKREHTLECISAIPPDPTIANAIWTGLPLLEIFTELGMQVPKAATIMKCSSVDGYTTGIEVADLKRPIWLVWQMNGQPIPVSHGFPVRMLVPGRYGTKNPKWLTKIDFIQQPYLGYWEQSGWSDDATYRPNTLIAAPDFGAKFPAGLLRVQGYAFAGSDPVVAVDVRVGVDPKGAWLPAVLDYAPGPDIWVLWHYDWLLKKTGNHTLTVRCTTKSGAMSIDGYKPGLEGYNGSTVFAVTVV